MNLSLAGCGGMGVYHIGVVSCFRTYAPHVLFNKISGCSSGSMVAVMMAAGCPLEEMASFIIDGIYDSRKAAVGALSPGFRPNSLIRQGLEKYLPEDAHLQVNGKLHVSLTRVKDGQSLVVSQFDTREEVIEAITASCWHPGMSGVIPPTFKGIRVIDGAYSNNMPILDEDTITVSPFPGMTDICPQTNRKALLINWLPNAQPYHNACYLSDHLLKRVFRVMRPPPPELAASYCKEGFEDTLRFLQSRYMIACIKCLPKASSLQLEEKLPHNSFSSVECEIVKRALKRDCGECAKQRLEDDKRTVPSNVVKVFDNYKEKSDQISYKQMIQDKKSLKMISYPSMLVALAGSVFSTTLVGFLSCYQDNALCAALNQSNFTMI